MRTVKRLPTFRLGQIGYCAGEPFGSCHLPITSRPLPDKCEALYIPYCPQFHGSMRHLRAVEYAELCRMTENPCLYHCRGINPKKKCV